MNIVLLGSFAFIGWCWPRCGFGIAEAVGEVEASRSSSGSRVVPPLGDGRAW